MGPKKKKKKSLAFPCDITVELREAHWPGDDATVPVGVRGQLKPVSLSRGETPLDCHGLSIHF